MILLMLVTPLFVGQPYPAAPPAEMGVQVGLVHQVFLRTGAAGIFDLTMILLMLVLALFVGQQIIN